MRPEIGEVWLVEIDEAKTVSEEKTIDLVYVRKDLSEDRSLIMIDSNEEFAIAHSLGSFYDDWAVSNFIKRVKDAEIY